MHLTGTIIEYFVCKITESLDYLYRWRNQMTILNTRKVNKINTNASIQDIRIQ